MSKQLRTIKCHTTIIGTKTNREGAARHDANKACFHIILRLKTIDLKSKDFYIIFIILQNRINIGRPTEFCIKILKQYLRWPL